ncbi:aminotransferase class V-fold PLP-dependent enzyme [Jiangella muralis]|uniref:aminotransferase class V-fold PLP-dependent enzyme n=1 Tax=Jiangella muralis TaxID=702383 RepID=UPI00069E9003|nr:aminotransferase class V-fold PLP-dependent enzyme [Jiangella muralis]
MSGADPAAMRAALVGVEDVVHLYTGAEGPPLRSHAEAALRYLRDKALGEEGRARFERELNRARASLGGLLGADPSSVAVLENASDAINRLVAAVPLAAGDNVVTSDLEFPAGVLPLVALRERDVDVRVLRTSGGSLTADDFAPVIDERTRLVLSSHVSYLSGARLDPARLRDRAHAVGAVFVLDATQSLGVVPVRAADADALVSSTYKWLLSPHGLGVLQVSAPEKFDLARSAVGWRSVEDLFAPDRFDAIHRHRDARAFELGYPNLLGVYLLNDSLDLLGAVGIDAIAGRVAALTAPLLDGLRAQGRTMLTPSDPSRRAGNVSVRHPDGRAAAVRLLDRGVRAWGGDGRVRFSVHGFSTESDIDRALAAFGADRS